MDGFADRLWSMLLGMSEATQNHEPSEQIDCGDANEASKLLPLVFMECRNRCPLLLTDRQSDRWSKDSFND